MNIMGPSSFHILPSPNLAESEPDFSSFSESKGVIILNTGFFHCISSFLGEAPVSPVSQVNPLSPGSHSPRRGEVSPGLCCPFPRPPGPLAVNPETQEGLCTEGRAPPACAGRVLRAGNHSRRDDSSFPRQPWLSGHRPSRG